MTALDANTIRRFWANVDKRGPDECWHWRGSFWRGGYGRMKRHGSRYYERATAISYLIHHGRMPNKPFLCHSCDNPPCVNPTHLWPGTVKDNSDDMHAKKRWRPGVLHGSHNGNAKLDEAAVREIRRMIAGGVTNVAIGRIFGVTDDAISLIRLGKKWAHVK